MELVRLLAELGEAGAVEAVRPDWEASVASFPAEGLRFLDPERYRTSRAFCGYDDQVDPILASAAEQIRADRRLQLLAWHAHQRLFTDPSHPEAAMFTDWPRLEGVMGERWGAFYLLIALELAPRLRALHAGMGIPEEVTRETCLVLPTFGGNFARQEQGKLGIPLRQLYWLRYHLSGRLFRIGRMEYMIRPFYGCVEVFRHRRSGAVVALAEDGVRFDEEGFVVGVPNEQEADPAPGWTASLQLSDTQATGYPVSPAGFPVREPVTLDLADWAHLVRRGMPVLDMHIPSGGGMSLEKCGDSMRRAVAFFHHYLPERTFAAIACWSWLFNPDLPRILPADSNLVRYQQELHLFPLPSRGSDGLYFIFMQNTIDPATAPRATSLQRAVADHMARGRRWRGGGMFYLPEDLPRFGRQPYRASWPPAALNLPRETPHPRPT